MLLRLAILFAFLAFWAVTMFDIVFAGPPVVVSISLFVFGFGEKHVARMHDEAVEGLVELQKLL